MSLLFHRCPRSLNKVCSCLKCKTHLFHDGVGPEEWVPQTRDPSQDPDGEAAGVGQVVVASQEVDDLREKIGGKKDKFVKGDN